MVSIICDHSVTEGYKVNPNIIKVVLDSNMVIYPHEYKEIEFFVYRNFVGTGWKATEASSGSILDMYPRKHATKRACIAAAHDLIDLAGTEYINELIDYAIENQPVTSEMTQTEYKKYISDDNNV